LSDEDELNKIYTKLSQELKSKEFRRYRRIDSETRILYDRDEWSLINEMTNDGIIFRENSKLTINQAMHDTMNKFVEFLKENKEFKRNRHFYIDREIKDIEYENDEK